MTKVVAAAWAPDMGAYLPRVAVPPPEPAQERYLRGIRFRLLAVSITFLAVLVHNRVFLEGRKFVYVLLILLNLLDNAFVYYLIYRGFLVEFLSYVRLTLDAYAITVVCHFTGSVTSVTPMAYVLLICATAVLSDRRHTMYCAWACVFAYIVLLCLEYTGVLAYATLVPDFRILPQEKLFAMATSAVFVPLLLFLTAILISDVAEGMQERERNLRNAHDDLRRASADLVAAQARLARSEKLASLGTLVAGVAHELNNPIGFISSNLEVLESYASRLERFADAQVPEEREKIARELRIPFIREELPALLADCKAGARRCHEIVDSLRDFSRPALQQSREVLLEDTLEQCLRLANLQIRDRVEIRREYGLRSPVRCIPGQLAQVFTNLILNGAQAIEGKGTITVETGRLSGKDVFVRVTDSGRGIPPADLARIFDPFFTTKEPGQGMGLGLAISYGIVEQHGGRIEVESEVGRGSAFTVVLPERGAGEGVP
ncbi:MAG: ATP-binding protein [Bdellovibrionota bacterium]